MAENQNDNETEKQNDNKGNNFFIRLCYGVVSRHKDTSTMTTRQVVDEFLKLRGVSSPKEFFKSISKRNKDSIQQKNDTEKIKNDMLSNDRMNYTKNITREKIAKTLDFGSQEMFEITAKLFVDDSFGIGAPATGRSAVFQPGFNKVGITKQDLEFEDGRAEGEVLYHEIWHAIDYNYGEINTADSDYSLSTTYILSNGKTFAQTLIDEYSKNIDVDALFDEREKDIDNYFSQQKIDRQEVLKKFALLSKRAEDIYSDVYEITKSYWEAYQAKIDFKNSPEYIEARKAYNKVKEAPHEIKVKWSDMSDIVSGATNNKKSLGFYHDAKYWKSEKGKRGKEAFAEFASAKSTNKESYKLLKKYLPETTNALDEILNKLKKGEIKPNGKPKYRP